MKEVNPRTLVPRKGGQVRVVPSVRSKLVALVQKIFDALLVVRVVDTSVVISVCSSGVSNLRRE